MAAGDNYLQCNPQLSLEQVFRDMIYDDGTGKPVLHTDPEGTDLEPFFTCGNTIIGTEQVFRLMVLEDENGKPYLNTTSSS